MRIFAIGRNFAEHAKELNNPVPSEPLIFTKPDTALVKNGDPMFMPDFTNDLHFEVELVIRLCKNGKNIEPQFARKYFDKVGIGIDFTARDLQQKFKDKGWPWDLAKGFDGAAPVSNFVSLNNYEDLKNINFSLYKNGEKVQDGNTSHMLFSFENIISYISKFITLRIGDLIFCGTPMGVGKTEIGDHFEAFIESKKMLDCKIR
ncbi:MAG: acylpyruvate hydrolase [Sphingobacteriales bacterium]|jgi:acylpyruvate hydrolase